MFFMYIVLSTAVLLLVSVAVAVFQQKKIKVAVIASEEVNSKNFFALRVESEDFLFVKNEMQDVSFVQCLDDADDFSIRNLAEKVEAQKQQKVETTSTSNDNVISLKGAVKGEKLVMPKSEKKVS